MVLGLYEQFIVDYLWVEGVSGLFVGLFMVWICSGICFDACVVCLCSLILKL